MQIVIKCFLFVFFLSPILVSGQIDFYKIYTNNGYDFGQGIVQLEDSSYVVTGSSSSFQNGASQAFLLKVDSLGNYKWSKNYGGFESEGGRRVLYKKNVGFFIAGYTNSYGNGGYDNYLIKTDEQGNLLWDKTYGGSGWEKVNDAILLPDTSIVMVGQTNTGTPGNDNFYIVRTNQNGDTLWTKNFGTAGNDFVTCVKILNDSMFVVGGTKYISDSLKNKAYLMCFKKGGKLVWENYFGNEGEYQINDISIVGNEINVVGFRKNFVLNDFDGYAAKVDINGNFIYEFAYSYTTNETYEQITSYGNSGKFYIVYNQQLDGVTFPIGKDVLAGRFTSGLVYDNHALGFSNTGDDISGQIIQTIDGGVIVVGYNTSFGAGGNNVFLTKIGANDVFPVTNGNPIINPLVKVNELKSSEIIQVYPTPTNDELNIVVPEGFEGEFEIKDVLGRSVYKEKIEKSKIKISMIKNDLQQGNYFIYISSKNNITFSTKVILIQN